MKLLVVEDEARLARILRRGFEEQGYAVDLADKGPDAVWLATENDYAAVILDVMLPGFDGFEVCRRLRDAERWAPIIMLTARGAFDDRVQGLDLGADDYMVKPFSFAELSARVRALVRRGSQARPNSLDVGTLRLEPSTRRVWRSGTEIFLSPKEYALLELLMRHPGEVVTRTTIIDQVWDFAYSGTFNVIEQYVGYLRRKIDRPFGRQDLETVRGVGYRLKGGPEA